MAKKLVLIGVVLLLMWLVVGCGIPQDQYDAVVGERDAANTQLASVVAERDAANTQLTSAVAERDVAKKQVTSLQSELNELKSSLKQTQTSLDTAKADYQTFKSDVSVICAALGKKLEANAMINRYWADAGRAEAGLMSASDFGKSTADFLIGLGGKLEVAGKEELAGMWKDGFAAAGRGDEKTFMANFATVMDSLTESINNDFDALEAKLR